MERKISLPLDEDERAPFRKRFFFFFHFKRRTLGITAKHRLLRIKPRPPLSLVEISTSSTRYRQHWIHVSSRASLLSFGSSLESRLVSIPFHLPFLPKAYIYVYKARNSGDYRDDDFLRRYLKRFSISGGPTNRHEALDETRRPPSLKWFPRGSEEKSREKEKEWM